MVTPSLRVGIPTTLVTGFLQHLYKNENYTTLHRNATKSLSDTIASNTFLLSSRIIEPGWVFLILHSTWSSTLNTEDGAPGNFFMNFKAMLNTLFLFYGVQACSFRSMSGTIFSDFHHNWKKIFKVVDSPFKSEMASVPRQHYFKICIEQAVKISKGARLVVQPISFSKTQ